MDISEYIIFTDIMKAVLAFTWIMYIWEAFIAKRQASISKSNPVCPDGCAYVLGLSVNMLGSLLRLLLFVLYYSWFYIDLFILSLSSVTSLFSGALLCYSAGVSQNGILLGVIQEHCQRALGNRCAWNQCGNTLQLFHVPTSPVTLYRSSWLVTFFLVFGFF